MPRIITALAITAAIAMTALWMADTTRAQTGASVDEVAIDVEVAGNEANSLGTTQFCNTTQIDVGDTFDIDVVVRGVPADPRLFGIGFNLLFDPAILRIDELHVNEEPKMMTGDLLYAAVDYNVGNAGNGPPGTTGNVRIDWVQSNAGTPPDAGDGVLLRVRVTAVGEGVSPILFGAYDAPYGQLEGDPGVLWATHELGDLYLIGSVNEGAVAVGDEPCPASPPTAIPTPTPSPPQSATSTPTQAPVPDFTVDELSIDADVAGNSASAVGITDFCNADVLAVGEQRDIDIIVRGLPPRPSLKGLEATVQFDENVLRIDNIQFDESPALLEPLKNRIAGFVDYDRAGVGIDPPPSTDGFAAISLGITSYDLGRPVGDGVLARITVTGIAPGLGDIMLLNLTLGHDDSVFEPFAIETSQDAVIAVGLEAKCPVAPTPTPTRQPVSTSTPTLLAPTPTVDQDSITPTSTIGPTLSPSATTIQPSAAPRGGAASVDGWSMFPMLAALAIVVMGGGWLVVVRARR